jgi:hypothetical protein
MKKLSERLGDLSARVKQTEDTIDAALARNREQLQAQQDALTVRVEAQQDRFSQQAAEARTELESNWRQLGGAVAEQFAAMRADAAERRADRDQRRAQRRADDAELDALMAVDFAIFALEQADYAIVEAAIARADADDLAAHK